MSCILLGGWHNHLAAQAKVVEMTTDEGFFQLDEFLSIYEDKRGEKTIWELLQEEGAFDTYNPSVPLNKNSTYWGKLLLWNHTDYPAKWVLSPDWEKLIKRNSHVEAYIPQNGVFQQTGRLLPFSDKSPPLQKSFNNQILLEFQPQDTLEVYLRIWQIDHKRPVFKIRLMDYAHRQEKSEEIRNITQAIFQGIVWIMLLYSLVVFWNLRDKSYLYYALFLLSTSFYFLYMSGVLNETLLREVPIASFYVWIFASNFLAVGYFQFARSFLKTKTHIPFWDRIGRGFIIGLSVLTLLEMIFISLTLNQAFLNEFNTITIFLEVSFLLVVSIFYIKTIHGLGKIFFWGTLCMVTAGFIGVYLEFTDMVHQSLPFIEFFFILEILTFSWGLSYRHYINQEQRLIKKAEANTLRELSQMKSRFFANISHELRTPLAVLMNMMDGLEDNRNRLDQLEVASHFQTGKRNIRTLLHLVNQILDLTKLESQKMDLNWEYGDILPFLKSIIEPFQIHATNQNIKFDLIIPESPVLMDFDTDSIQSILSNLLSNAIKFTPSSGTIQLTIRSEREKGGGQLEISVKDSGKGISEADLPHIFDRYFQSSNKQSTYVSSGTGIGLALVKEQVGLIGGKIRVQSEFNKGSRFHITIPIHHTHTQTPWKEKTIPSPVLPMTQAQIEKPKTGIPDFEQPSILLIEDNEDLLSHLKSVFEGSYRTQVARNGQEGIDLATEIVPDLIISDVMMPQKSGFEVCESLKQDKRTSHIPIILLTARASQEYKIQGLTYGADAYLTKPAHRDELLVRVAKLIEQRKTLQSLFSSIEGKSEDRKQEKEHAFVEEAKRLIETNLDQETFDIEALCKALGMSHVQVFRKLKALTGLSIQLFFREIRLEKAHQLLLTSDLNVSEIAYEVGFKDPAYFSRVFSQKYGMSPNAIRS